MSYFSINRFPGDGITLTREISFAGGYLDQSHVKAYREDANGLRYPRTDFSFVGPYTVVFTDPTPVGEVLGVYRDTPKGTPLVDFTSGARLTEANLDIAATQSIFVAAEAYDQFTETIGSSQLALEQSAAALIAAQEALTIAQDSGSNAQAAFDASQQALAFASTALTTAQTAEATANNAAALAVTASSNAASALALATTADANAALALLQVNDVYGLANDAAIDAEAALLLAQSLQLQVNTVEATANEALVNTQNLLNAMNVVLDNVSTSPPYNITTASDFGDLTAASGDFANEVNAADLDFTMSKGSASIDYGTL